MLVQRMNPLAHIIAPLKWHWRGVSHWLRLTPYNRAALLKHNGFAQKKQGHETLETCQHSCKETIAVVDLNITENVD